MNPSSLFALLTWLAVSLHFHTKIATGLSAEGSVSTGVYSSSSANSLREQLREERSSGREMLFMWINHGFQGLQTVLLLLTDQYLNHSPFQKLRVTRSIKDDRWSKLPHDTLWRLPAVLRPMILDTMILSVI